MTSIIPLLKQAHAASAAVRLLTDADRTAFLNDLSESLLANVEVIMMANAQDLALLEDSNPMKDRLLLDKQRIEALAEATKIVAYLPDPTGKTILEKQMPNGMMLSKITVPLGVVGIIYESRPNVTVDVAAICIRSGNAVVLRGGSDAWHTNLCLVGIIHQVLLSHHIDPNCVTLLPTQREFVKEMLTATRYIDVIIPRGSDRLINFVRANSLVPTIETGAGVVHVYVHEAADLQKAKAIVINAKVSRPSVCNALDTMVIDKKIASDFIPTLIEDLLKWKVEIFADHHSYLIFEALNYPFLQKASEEDFGREFLDYKCSVKIVPDFAGAIQHINEYSSRHSEAIVSENQDICHQFIHSIDAAAVYTNASTRFTDGGEFGLGAEVGISTQKLHARGPFALEKLITEKWIGVGTGQVR
jgi:glutamate-5-semialdehyde dehydrogenase